MFCTKARNWINLERDGQLPADKTVPLEKHLDSCAECRAYRDDLALASRLLAATAEQPADNFDWKLQLRLNQTLREAAGDGTTPWQTPRRNSLRWLRGFAVSSAAGLAASIAFILLVMPAQQQNSRYRTTALDPVPAASVSRSIESPDSRGAAISTVNRSAGDLDRRALSLFSRPSTRSRSGLLGQPVQLSGDVGNAASRQLFDRHNLVDLKMISRLTLENSRLRAELGRLQQAGAAAEALIDSTNSALLDSVGINR